MNFLDIGMLIRPYRRHEWRTATVLFPTYVLALFLSSTYLPAHSYLYPALAVAVCGLFFGGTRLWPIVLAGSLITHSGLNDSSWLLMSIIETLQVVTIAHLLRTARIDPLFRRHQDTLSFILGAAVGSLVLPLALAVFEVLRGNFFSWSLFEWRYAGVFLPMLVLTPFLMRWIAKPRFSRNPREVLEILIVFGVLIALNVILFTDPLNQDFGSTFGYILLIPLFWTSLRLRPRFVTLALVITSSIAIYGALVTDAPANPTTHLFGIEVLLIALGTMFFVVASLEEDRRLNTNLMRSHLSALENALARLNSESKAKNDFIAVLAHELRNPLAPIVSAVDFMKLKSDRDPEEIELLEVMENRMTVVRRLLDDLLDVSRISEGKLTIRKEQVDMRNVLRRALISTAHHITERHQTLTVHDSKKPLMVAGDPVRLEQIISNLITNASKYSDSGGQITVTLASKNHHAELSVKDNGIGIPADALDHIFTPFHQIGTNARTQKGLGIGLALVRSFVDVHNGTISVSSKGSGKGSTFTVCIPLYTPGEQPSSEQVQHSLLRTADVDKRTHVLIVEDSDAAAWSMGRLLELRDCAVSYAYETTQALHYTEDRPFDIIIVDMGLPHESAYALAQALLHQGFTGTLVALLTTDTEETRHLAHRAGFTACLKRPVSATELIQILPEQQNGL